MFTLQKEKSGLRTKENSKVFDDNKVLISIITVVFNCEKYIEETICNVISQTYNNIEYIIIDGGSTDGTVDIIKKYEDSIDYWISEKDSGIYDAMNKGIDLANGKWINFMNAGDRFYNNTVIKTIFENSNFNNIDVIYGNHQVVYPNRKRIVKVKTIQNIWKGSQFSHQSAFILASHHKANKFNISNRIGADFEFFYKSYGKNKRFKYIDNVISSVSSGGLSDINRIDSIVGWWNIVEKNNKTNFYYILLVLKEIIKKSLKKTFKMLIRDCK